MTFTDYQEIYDTFQNLQRQIDECNNRIYELQTIPVLTLVFFVFSIAAFAGSLASLILIFKKLHDEGY